MSDAYIRCSAAIDLIRRHIGNLHTSREESLLAWVVGALQTMPAADVVPAMHGQWVHSRYENCSERLDIVKCSQCGFEAYAIAHYVRGGNYCPNCGARMDGGDSHAAD